MDLLYILYTYNRPAVLNECLRTLFDNNQLRPNRVVIIDDGSQQDLKMGLAKLTLETPSTIDLISFKENVGYGRTAEIGFAVADMFQPKYCFFIETDYIYRKHGLDEVMDLLTSDIGQKLAGVVGYSHPSFTDPNCVNVSYPADLRRHYGQDNLNREILFKPFPFKSRFGQIQVQFASNSCGTMYLNWELITQMRKHFYPRMEHDWIDRVVCKGQEKRLLDDGIMSHGLSYFWTEYAKAMGWDTDKYAALADIVPSVANHLCAGGINGKDFALPEGGTFVGSPSFPQNYNEYAGRQE